ncbi:MAG: hypothetical protein M3Y08_20435 [Fibrobacterota bacterium]|nr:hypothetical protein [Fibrobacterota bacterium]
MKPAHSTLAEGRWFEFSLCAQMANIGSEVERAINWGRKGNPTYKQLAFYRAIELIDLTLRDPRHRHRLREITRVREALADFLAFDNEYNSTEAQWKKYFLAFAYAARQGR